MTNQMLQENQNKPARLLVAVEMSLKNWRLAMAVENQPKKRIKTIEAGDYAALAAAVAEAKDRLKLAGEAGVVFCYEAGRDGFYPYRQLTAAGHEVWVVDPASIEVSRRRRRAKSDGIDADKLSELMQRRARGEPKVLQSVRVPSVEVEDQRMLPREREILLKDRQRLRNQIGSVLFAQGYREVPDTAQELKAWLDNRQEVGTQLRERLAREIERLALLERQCQEVEKELARQIRQDEGGAIAAVARALMQLAGIGLIGAWVLASELFGWRQFRNRREVGAVAGLTPTPYSSGEDEREQGISKAGNRRARYMLVELAWFWLRYQPDSALSRWFKTRFMGGGRRMKRIGIVALARRLAIALWRYVDQGVVPEGATLKGARA